MNFYNYINSLADRTLASNWLASQPGEQIQQSSVRTLTQLAMASIEKRIEVQPSEMENLKKTLPFIKDVICLNTSSFTTFYVFQGLVSEDASKQVLKRLQLSRNFMEQGSDKEILLKRIFENILSHTDYQEKLKIIENKRKLSLVNTSAYSLVSLIEKTQRILAKITKSKVTKVCLTLLMIVVTVLGLFILDVVKKDCVTSSIRSYINLLSYIPRGINASQPYRNFSIPLLLISGLVSYLIHNRDSNLAKISDLTFFLSIVHWCCATISEKTGFPISKVLSTLVSFIPYGNGLLWFPYVAPVVYPIAAMTYTANSSTSLASRTLEITANKLEIWRIKAELNEAKNIWITSFLNASTESMIG